MSVFAGRAVGRCMLAAAMVCSALPATAGDQGDATAGLEVGRRWCANCHVVEPGQRSGSDSVPTFASIAARPNLTPESLKAFLRAPHTASKMTDFHLSQTDIDNAVAYLRSLRP